MCSIMGWCGSDAILEKFLTGFERTKSRGPDDSRIVDTGKGLLGFHRLSIMGLTPSGMQPFELDGSYVVCNGELYGFEKMREDLIGKGYTFRSDSDCEIILPLYFEYGTDMFSMLDAEFVCVLYDGRTGEYIAARDPIGIRPLYYGYSPAGTILFASEPKTSSALPKRSCRSRRGAITGTGSSSATPRSRKWTRSAVTAWKRRAGRSGKSWSAA